MGAEKVHEFNEAGKGMKPSALAKSAASRLFSLKAKGGKTEAKSQAKAMSKTKRKARFKRGATAPGGY